MENRMKDIKVTIILTSTLITACAVGEIEDAMESQLPKMEIGVPPDAGVEDSIDSDLTAEVCIVITNEKKQIIKSFPGCQVYNWRLW